VSATADQARDLRERHFGPRPLVLANVWDAVSARTVAEAGAPVIATSSAAVAASLGLTDHQGMNCDTAFAAIGRIAAAVEVPVTADIEAGYGLPAAELAERLIAAGAVGCNIEDSDHSPGGLLLDLSERSDYIAAVIGAGRTYGIELVVNARVDSIIRRVGTASEQIDDAARRARAYLEAGATCVYPIGVSDELTTKQLVDRIDGPVNVWLRPDSPPVQALCEIGVARISLAGGLLIRTMKLAAEITTQLLADADEWHARA
jgi:2-methylisocitrate lyase-like PEP mutase family enzyme